MIFEVIQDSIWLLSRSAQGGTFSIFLFPAKVAIQTDPATHTVITIRNHLFCHPNRGLGVAIPSPVRRSIRSRSMDLSRMNAEYKTDFGISTARSFILKSADARCRAFAPESTATASAR